MLQLQSEHHNELFSSIFKTLVITKWHEGSLSLGGKMMCRIFRSHSNELNIRSYESLVYTIKSLYFNVETGRQIIFEIVHPSKINRNLTATDEKNEIQLLKKASNGISS